MVFRDTGQELSYTTEREVGPGGRLSTTHEARGTGDGSDFSGGEVLSILLIYAGRSAPSGPLGALNAPFCISATASSAGDGEETSATVHLTGDGGDESARTWGGSARWWAGSRYLMLSPRSGVSADPSAIASLTNDCPTGFRWA